MQCHDAEERMPALLDGTLAPDEAQSLSTHLESCARCRQFRVMLVENSVELRAAPFAQSPPPFLAERAFNAAMTAVPGTTGSFIDALVHWGWRFAVGGTALAVAAAVMLFAKGGVMEQESAGALVKSYVAASDVATTENALWGTEGTP